MNNDWKRVGEFASARRRELEMTQPQVTERGGPSPALIRQVESGTYKSSMQSTVRRGYESALRWRPGTIDELLDGGTPSNISADTADAPSIHVRPDRDWITEVSVRAELDADGEVVEVVAWSQAQLSDQSPGSRMELRYRPGPGRTIRSTDVGPLVGQAHRAALRVTTPLIGKGGDADDTGRSPSMTKDDVDLVADVDDNMDAEAEADPHA